MNFKYKEEYKYPTNMCLNVTDACNLSCRYCFVEQHPHYMTLDTAKQAIKWIINNRKKKNKIYKYNITTPCTVAYFGGEPSLMWDEIIVPLTLWTEKKYPKKIKFTITTNGTLLNEERIKFLFEHNISPLLSIDGNKITQDYNRPCHNGQSSFDLISKNFKILLKYFPETTFRSTIIPETVDQLFNNFIFAIENGFKNYFMTPNEREIWSKESEKKLELEVYKIFTFYCCCFEKNMIPAIKCSVIQEAFENVIKNEKHKLIHNNFRLNNKPIERCGLGTVSVSVGYDGSIYGCQEQPSKENNIFYLGNIKNGIDEKKQKILLSKFYFTKNEKCINEQRCLNCPVQNICSATSCPSSQFDQFQNFQYTSDIKCFWNQILYKYSNNLLSNITMDNKAFLYYLKNFTNLSSYLKEVK